MQVLTEGSSTLLRQVERQSANCMARHGWLIRMQLASVDCREARHCLIWSGVLRKAFGRQAMIAQFGDEETAAERDYSLNNSAKWHTRVADNRILAYLM